MPTTGRPEGLSAEADSPYSTRRTSRSRPLCAKRSFLSRLHLLCTSGTVFPERCGRRARRARGAAARAIRPCANPTRRPLAGARHDADGYGRSRPGRAKLSGTKVPRCLPPIPVSLAARDALSSDRRRASFYSRRRSVSEFFTRCWGASLPFRRDKGRPRRPLCRPTF